MTFSTFRLRHPAIYFQAGYRSCYVSNIITLRLGVTCYTVAYQFLCAHRAMLSFLVFSGIATVFRHHKCRYNFGKKQMGATIIFKNLYIFL